MTINIPSFVPKPEWLIRLTNAYMTFDVSHPKRLRFQHENKTTETFWSFFEPLFSASMPELEAALDKLAAQYGFPLVDKNKLIPFLEPAVETIAEMAQRAFVLELRVAKKANELSGNTPNERFDNFFEQLKETSAALNFFEIYPFLGRLAYQVCEDWKTYFLEIITHLYTDLLELQTKIPPLSKFRLLTDIKASLTHGVQTGGRTVVILSFDETTKLAYKPRDSAIDVAYGQFLVWFNAQNTVPPIRHLEIVSRPNHSWFEFATPEKELPTSELPILYTKIGALLCLMYLFDSMDMHDENIIVVGNSPVLIDLETWLQPLFPNSDRRRSVHNTQFLPQLETTLPDAFDLEGITAADLKGKMWTDAKCLVWENEGTDEMRIVRKRTLIDNSMNGRRSDGSIQNPADYTACITKGFRQVYRHIAAHKAAFLAATACFKAKKIRIFLRESIQYDVLIEEIGHPNHLQDALALDQFLDRLWISATEEPYLKSLIDIEKKDLMNLNSPYFYTYSDSKDLFYNNQPIIKDFFEKTALELVAENIETMSTKDLERQVRIIRRAFAKLKQYAL